MDSEIIRQRQRKAMQHLGQTIEIDGKDYDCFPTGMRDTALRNRDQTFRENYQTSVSIIADDASVSVGDVVTYAGTESRVLETSKTGDGIQTILHLGKKYGER